jgi:heat-inducible transcriptional repressor
MAEQLSERQRTILRDIIHSFVVTANPVGSRYLSKEFDLGLSPATIRNVMSDLEEGGYISHPHTSAGRVPTDKGYRYYVNALMDLESPTDSEKRSIRRNLKESMIGPDDILKEASKILGKISKQLSIVSSPHISTGILERLEMIHVSNNRIMVVISVRYGLVRTIMMEVHHDLSRDRLDEIVRILNERLCGLTLQLIKDTFADRVRDVQDEDTGLIRLFIGSADRLFDDTKEMERLHIGGTRGAIQQPEFTDPRSFSGVIELIDNEDIIIHLLEKRESRSEEVTITIGEENKEERLRDYSLITSKYEVGEVDGIVGVIGPRRMNYSKLVSLVDYMAKAISNSLS